MMGIVKSEAITRALETRGSLGRHGEERDITVMFTDIRNFTVFSDNHRAPEVVSLLNEFFTVAVPIVEGQWGIAIADVSGKGIPAALIMAGFRASLIADFD